MTIEDIARVCNDVNRSYCMAMNVEKPTWDEASAHIKQSATLGVKFHLAGDHDAAASHRSWLRKKEEDGWTYGELIDEQKKTHPCILPHDELPLFDQAKDYIFLGVVNALKPHLDPAEYVEINQEEEEVN